MRLLVKKIPKRKRNNKSQFAKNRDVLAICCQDYNPEENIAEIKDRRS